MWKKITSALLTVALAFSMCPASALASTSDGAESLTRQQVTATLDKAVSGKKLRGINVSYDFDSPAAKKVKKEIKKVAKASGSSKIGIVCIDLDTGEGFSYNPKQSMFSASTIKGPYVVSLGKYKPSAIKSNYAWAKRAVKYSDNSAYWNLYCKYQRKQFNRFRAYCGVKSSQISMGTNYGFYDTRTLAKLWTGMYWYFFKSTNSKSKTVRNMFTTGKNGKNAIIYNALHAKYKGKGAIYEKAGWNHGPGKWRVQNDAALLRVNGRNYLIVIMSGAYKKFGSLKSLAKAVDGLYWDMVQANESEEPAPPEVPDPTEEVPEVPDPTEEVLEIPDSAESAGDAV